MIDPRRLFDTYIEIFESTFKKVSSLDSVRKECRDQVETLGLIGDDPFTLAHQMGIYLLSTRLTIPVNVSKVEGDRFMSWDKGGRDENQILFWRDRPIWDEFDVCRECGGLHPSGYDLYTKAPVLHDFFPKRKHTLYLRFLITGGI